MSDPTKARRARARARRQRADAQDADPTARGAKRDGADTPASFGPATGPGVGWDHDAEPTTALAIPEDRGAPLAARVLSVFAEPGVHVVTPSQAARALGEPIADVENALEGLAQAGELQRDEHSDLYAVDAARKAQLELMFREAAHELGETNALMRRDPTDLSVFDDDEEPRLPVTAGLLSLFLPGTGQLLNGDVGRASLVFAVWSLALLTHLSPIWTFVALYAGAEAFFTAKIRGIERKLELEAAAGEPKPT